MRINTDKKHCVQNPKLSCRNRFALMYLFCSWEISGPSFVLHWTHSDAIREAAAAVSMLKGLGGTGGMGGRGESQLGVSMLQG